MNNNTIKTICLQCKQEFYTPIKEVKRGKGRFCSLKCAAVYNNNHREYSELICQNLTCGRSYQSKNKNSKYCSIQCRNQIHYLNHGPKSSHSSTLRRRIEKFLNEKSLICFICGWNQSTCDIHHINPKGNNGTDTFDNITILCPNHHRLADQKKINKFLTVSEWQQKNPS